MSFIGEAVLSAFLAQLFEKLTSSALNYLADYKQVHSQLTELQSKLQDIRSVLDDAEQKQIKNEGVKKWLVDLQDLAYDVDDILDEFDYEALRPKLQKNEASPSKVRNLMSTCFCCATGGFDPASSEFRSAMIPKMREITDRLKSLTERRTSLGLNEIKSEGVTARLQPTSVMDDSVTYVGRETEKKEILDWLKCSNTDGAKDGASVVSVVGLGGMGKTTLAQLVYNDSSIRSSFDCKAWVCVSDNFDAVTITKTILESVTPGPCGLNDLNLLQVKLKENLSGKKFLLVLDDIWNESYSDWTILRAPFGAGTKIIVTTRLQNVSSIVHAVKAFQLDKLSHDDCLSIFAQHVLGARNFDDHPKFKEVGKKLVRKCNGLPLAAKAIGGLLNTIELDPVEWEKIYESKIWGLPEYQCGIIPALQLSYHHLPSHLKRCFAYCSIFPKDYEFEEEEIILLWRAEGFLQRKTKNGIIDLGNQYFRDLMSRSFFQISTNDKYRFVMHDLINDLAQVVAGEVCSKLEGCMQPKISPRTRHSSYVASEYDVQKKFEAFKESKNLRTFLPLSSSGVGELNFLSNIVIFDLLPKLECLRVLSLKGYCIKELPDIFENLKHLRYLDFSYTAVKSLPDSICILYHLDTLILRGCGMLEELPTKIENLVNLHYLDIRGADLVKKMPFGIGELINLQKLSNFIVGEGDGHSIRELKNLSNIRSKLCLSGLENIVKHQDALEATLTNKSRVDRLVLRWSEDFDNNRRNKEVEERVLDSLHPPIKLKKLTIQNYGGGKISTWIAETSSNNLMSLKLINCKTCTSLPSIGKLPVLKHLFIQGMHEIEKVGDEFFGENQPNAFASLESLQFKDMRKWKEWDCCEGDEQIAKFPSLRELCIEGCPLLLGTLPKCIHSLQRLVIKDCVELIVSIEELCFSNVADVSSLKNVCLSNIAKLKFPPERIVSKLTKLESLCMEGFKELASLSEDELRLLGHLSSLREIEISGCPQLIFLETEDVEEEKLQLGKISRIESLSISCCERFNRLPKVLYALTYLTEMRIYKCPGLIYFAVNSFPPALKKLEISQCKNLQSLVDERENKRVNEICVLEYLNIRNCPSLKCLLSRADLLPRLQNLQIRECSKMTCLFSDARLPIMLQKISISLCKELECIAQEFDETSCLESIFFYYCRKIKSLPQGLDKLNHLQDIKLLVCSSLVSFEESGIPPAINLRVLSIAGCENFEVLPKCMYKFTSLRKLTLNCCSFDISFPEGGFPTNLTSLAIIAAPKIYKSIVQWGFDRLTSLQKLCIEGEGCSDVVSFPEKEMMLPSSLSYITVRNFENLEYMVSSGFCNVTSFQKLTIENCSKLTTLPDKDMLLSLEELLISGCPLLEEECKGGRGREWSKIAHIPHVLIH